MWASLLLRFWKPAIGILIGAGAVWYLHHHGYESGYAAADSKWHARFAQAERDRDAANEKARRTEEDSRAISARSESIHAEQIASITSRAADAERRVAGLVRQLSTRTSCSTVPKASGAAKLPDAAPAVEPIVEQTSADLIELARRCESDAATLAGLQQWVREQQALFGQ